MEARCRTVLMNKPSRRKLLGTATLLVLWLGSRGYTTEQLDVPTLGTLSPDWLDAGACNENPILAVIKAHAAGEADDAASIQLIATPTAAVSANESDASKANARAEQADYARNLQI